MGLDLYISEQTNEHYDDKGRMVYTVTELDNFRGCWNIKELLDKRQFLDNCSTVAYNEGTFFAVLDELREMPNVSEREVEQLECFIEENGLKREKLTDEDKEYGTDECYGRTFKVHAWW